MWRASRANAGLTRRSRGTAALSSSIKQDLAFIKPAWVGGTIHQRDRRARGLASSRRSDWIIRMRSARRQPKIAAHKAGILKAGAIPRSSRRRRRAQWTSSRRGGNPVRRCFAAGSRWDAYALSHARLFVQTEARNRCRFRRCNLAPIDNAGLACAALLVSNAAQIGARRSPLASRCGGWPGRLRPLTGAR